MADVDNYDPWLARIGVLLLGLTAFGAGVTAAVILLSGGSVPCAVEEIGVGAVSALGTVVASVVRRGNGRP